VGANHALVRLGAGGCQYTLEKNACEFFRAKTNINLD
jgi:hypothetical protein